MGMLQAPYATLLLGVARQIEGIVQLSASSEEGQPPHHTISPIKRKQVFALSGP